jgi:nitrate reductase molybdenum cofactor assembly chaperone NarJ/NarW
MTIAETYTFLSRMIGYPEKKEVVHASGEAVSRFLHEQGIDYSLAPFTEFVARSSLATLQEEYIATFDFNPALALYLGHHLYGDNQKKALYLIDLKQEYRRYSFAPSTTELPDHLPLVLEFLAHLSRNVEDEARQAFITNRVLPGMDRLLTGFASRKNSPWQAVVEATRFFCSTDVSHTDRKEVRSCSIL